MYAAATQKFTPTHTQPFTHTHTRSHNEINNNIVAEARNFATLIFKDLQNLKHDHCKLDAFFAKGFATCRQFRSVMKIDLFTMCSRRLAQRFSQTQLNNMLLASWLQCNFSIVAFTDAPHHGKVSQHEEQKQLRHRRTADGARRLCNISCAKPSSLCSFCCFRQHGETVAGLRLLRALFHGVGRTQPVQSK
jgi:hypothetical protein